MILLLIACRADPGLPDYPERLPWERTGDDFYDDPLAEGEERLGIGLFYEGETTTQVEINDTTTHFYIYENTFTISTTDRRYEGYEATVITRGNLAWWGGGVHWDVPGDLGAYRVLNLAVRSSYTDSWEIGITGGGQESRISIVDYGGVADGDWHRLRIPLEDFEGVNLSAVTVPLLLVGEAGAAGDTLSIDDLYFTSEGA
jgi:hypothetical protein